MQPLKITFSLRTPVCIASPWLNFDGIVAHLIARKQLGESFYTLPSKTPVSLQQYSKTEFEPLPLRILRYGQHNERFIYHASVSDFGVDAKAMTVIYKKFNEAQSHEVETRKTKIRLGSGMLRSWLIQLPYIPADTCVFHVCGDESRLDQLLSQLVGLGKKTSIGFGALRDFEIEEEEQDSSLESIGIATRPLPTEILGKYDDQAMIAVRAPYWARENVELCAPPGSHIELKLR